MASAMDVGPVAERRIERDGMNRKPYQSARVGVARLLATLGGLVILLLTIAMAGSAHANTPVKEFSITPSATQAGGHPDITADVWLSNTYDQNLPQPDCECHDAKNISIDAPAGAIPDVYATPRCSAADFGANLCPIDSQIGVVSLGVAGSYPGNIFPGGPVAVYNLVPHPGQAGLVGFFAPVLLSPIFTVVEGRTESDYGLEFTVSNINHVFSGISIIEQTFWGVPADHGHDAERQHPVGCTLYGVGGAPECEGGAVSNAPLAPFIDAPTVCGEALQASVTVRSYDLGMSSASAPFAATTGCDQLAFNPSLFAQPTTSRADTASGLDVDLKVPQTESPTTPSASEIRESTVTLPPGFSINPNAADGKASCSAVQARVGIRHEAAQCPEASKIGSLTIESSALPGPLPGYVYLGDPLPGNRYRLWLIADGFGQHVKLPPASVYADPSTGQLTTKFDELPQFPFTDFNLHLFGSERGLLATPKQCGSYPVESTFVPWDADLPKQESTQYFTIDEGPNGSPCPSTPRPFHPSVNAGVADKGAGVHSPFTLEASRSDGDQELLGIDVTAPPGFSATLKGVPYCPETAIQYLQSATYSGQEEINSSSCPAASQVGTAVAGAGAGTHPLYVQGKVYLAGPYKGAPLSLETVIPAVSGPYDLGVAAVRTAVAVNARTAQVSASSDPLPQILEGVPLRTRYIRISLDRPNFALNPTNCDPLSIQTTLLGGEGGSVAQGTHFQVANCAALTFGPKLALTLRGSTRRLGHPSVHAVLTTNPGEANISRAVVGMPSVLQLDNDHIGNVCTNVQYKAKSCPTSSVIGRASATTPLLAERLQGNVYLRSNPTGTLPVVVAELEGQIDIELVGEIDTAHGGLRTTFASVPDAPVSSFTLDLDGKAKGLLRNTESLCKQTRKANVQLDGQNEAQINRKTRLRTRCGAANKKHKRNTSRHDSARKAA